MAVAKLSVSYATWVAATRDHVRKERLQSTAMDQLARTLRKMRRGRVAACFSTLSLFAQECHSAEVTALGVARRKVQAARILHRAVRRMRMNVFVAGFRSWRSAVRDIGRKEERHEVAMALTVRGRVGATAGH